jgi:hypothetical protein
MNINSNRSARRLRHDAVLLSALVAAVAVNLAACATLIHGTRQEVSISSTPSGASVSIDGASRGTTPFVAQLARNHSHLVKIEMPGYAPYEATLSHRLSGWIFGNVLIGGLIGIGVDVVSGGMYTLTPQQISTALKAADASVVTRDDGLYVVAVLEPAADWVKVAQLARAGT